MFPGSRKFWGLTRQENESQSNEAQQDARPKEDVERALIQTERKHRLLYENLSVGIFHYDTSGYLTNCNQAFIDILGSSWEKVQNLSLLELPNKQACEAPVKREDGQRY